MKIVNKKKQQLKIVIFTAVKNGLILHGRVFVMESHVKADLNLHLAQAQYQELE